MNWRERLRKVERVLAWLAWAGLAVVFALFVWNPINLPEILTILLAICMFVVLLGSTLFLIWFYRRWTITWPGLILIWALVAVANAWPLIAVGASSSGIYTFGLITSLLALWGTLVLMMVYRDVGLVLGVTTLILFAWSAGIANVWLGGPDKLLITLITEGDTGRIWWYNTLLTGLMCIAPLAPFTFGGWLLIRLYREFLGRGSI